MRFKFIAVVLVTLVTSSPLVAGQVFESDGAAIRGYDPVAYFTMSKPIEGKTDHSHQWRGVTWRFANAENLNAFQADPTKYAPQFGGYCAWAVSQGYSAPVDPEAWRIVDGKLYLNYSHGVQRRWATDIPGNIQRGNDNWPRVKSGL